MKKLKARKHEKHETTISPAVREARAGLIPSEETDALTPQNNICQNCRKAFADYELEEIGLGGFWERVQQGEIVPSGECPECGSLCHPAENALTPFVVAAKKLVETVAATGGLLRYPNGTTAPAGEPDWIDLGDTVVLLQGLLLGEGINIEIPSKRVRA